MHLTPYQRLVASVLVLIPIGITVAHFMAYADDTLPHDSVTIMFAISAAASILLASGGTWLVYRSAGADYVRWLWALALPGLLSCGLVGLLAWLISQRWATLTAGTADQYLVFMAVAPFLIGGILTVLIQSAFVLDFGNPHRTIKPWGREPEQWADNDVDAQLRRSSDQACATPTAYQPSQR